MQQKAGERCDYLIERLKEVEWSFIYSTNFYWVSLFGANYEVVVVNKTDK